MNLMRSSSYQNKTRVTHASSLGIWLMVILSPFFSFIMAFRNYKFTLSKNLVWLFVVFYGLTFVISNEYMDANRYRDQLIEYYFLNNSLDSFLYILFSPETNYVDFFNPLVTFLVSRFTDNFNILFAVYGLVFGYFFSRNIWFLFENVKGNINYVNLPILICYILTVCFWEINGFRFWTASHVFLFGLLPYLFYSNKKYLWVSFLSVFIHFSFAIPCVIFLLYLVLGNRIHLYMGALFVSFFITELDFDFIKYYFTYLPDVFQGKSESYLREDVVQGIASRNLNWYADLYIKGLKLSILGVLILLYLKKRTQLKNMKNIYSIFCFTILFVSFTNVLSVIPSVDRFIVVSFLFFFAFLFFYIQNTPQLRFSKILVLVLLPSILLFSIMQLRFGFATIGLLTVIGNPITFLFVESNTALIDIFE